MEKDDTYLKEIKNYILNLLNSRVDLLNNLDNDHENFLQKDIKNKDYMLSIVVIRITNEIVLAIVLSSQLQKGCYDLYLLSNKQEYWDNLVADKGNALQDLIIYSIRNQINIDLKLKYNRITKTLSDIKELFPIPKINNAKDKENNRFVVMSFLKRNVETIKKEVIDNKGKLVIPINRNNNLDIYLRFEPCEKENTLIAYSTIMEMDEEIKNDKTGRSINERFIEHINNQKYIYQAIIDVNTFTVLSEEHLPINESNSDKKPRVIN